MIRISTLIWTLLVALSGYAMFMVKNEVVRLDDRLAQINRQTADDRDRIQRLNVQWAVETQPARLEALDKNVLTLAPIRTPVLGALDQPPLRVFATSPIPGSQPDGTARADAATAQIAEIPVKATP